MMIGLALLVSGMESVEPVIAVGGVLVTLGILAFLYNVLTHVKSTHRRKR